MRFSKKHQPKNMDEIIIEDINTKQRLEEYAAGVRTGNLLLHGPQGTGKSSIARVIGETLYGAPADLFTEGYEGANFCEDDLDKIMKGWNWQRSQGVKSPFAIINEIDRLPTIALEKLKAFMDQHEDLGRIIATTNNPHRLSAPQRDRFDIVELPAINPDAFLPRMRQILESEGVSIDDDDLLNILQTSDGSWRQALAAAEDLVLAIKRQKAA